MRTTRSVRFLLLAIIFLVPEAVHAQSIIGDVWVMGEEEVSDSASCRLSYPSAIAAVQSVLRENRIPISYKRTPGHVRAYLNFTPINIGSACAVNYEIQFGFIGTVFFPSAKKLIAEDVLLCFRGGIMSGPTYDLQARINSSYADMAKQCISQVEEDLSTQ